MTEALLESPAYMWYGEGSDEVLWGGVKKIGRTGGSKMATKRRKQTA
jgi:hypothetical protein